jgi:rare lipoprotein A
MRRQRSGLKGFRPGEIRLVSDHPHTTDPTSHPRHPGRREKGGLHKRLVHMTKILIASALAAKLLVAGSAHASPAQAPDGVSRTGIQAGMASYYSDRFHGRRTASGARYDRNAYSAAHRTLPLGTRVRVVDAASGDSVVVRINDRGPFVRGRVIDLSRAAASEIGLTRKGVTKVRVEVLGQPRPLTVSDLF